MKAQLHTSKRLVIKVGSSILMGEAGAPRADWLATLAQDIADARARGTQVIVVTSGAVAMGRATLGMPTGVLKLEEKQAAAACGQISLVQAWRVALGAHAIHTAQVLVTIDDSEDRRRYLNVRNTLETLLEHGVVPVINENDTVATAELRFGDNDRLAARVAQMASADTLLLLSDIDGLYTANPAKEANAQFIPQVSEITPQIQAMAGGASSAVGSGGMVTKIEAAKIALAAGCHMIIAPGKLAHPLRACLEGGRGTWFIAQSTPRSARKHWISGSIAPMGAVVIDAGAAAALASGKSLLPAGVTSIQGLFERGDAVIVKDETGVELARGLIAYSSADAQRILGRKSQDIEQILGFKGRSALIHRDDLVLR